jgi:hypothetical protein
MPCELNYTVFPQFYSNETQLYIHILATQDFGKHDVFTIDPLFIGALVHDTANRVVNGSDSIGVTYIGSYGTLYKSNYDPNGNHIISHFDITTIDSANQVVAGTFSFTLHSLDWLDSAIVTDGRFDFKFRNYCGCSK